MTSDRERPIYIIHLQPTPDCTDSVKAIRELLKRAWRSWGLKCLTIRELKEGDQK
jgi:hypothetical protein